MNTAAPSPDPDAVWGRVLRIQRKLHQWATDDRSRRFDDLFNLVCDPATLLAAWGRVRENKGARSAGIDGRTVTAIEGSQGVESFLDELRASLKSGEFRPAPVREVLIPKRDGKKRRLGIPTVADRVVQAALKIVLEPIFEADFEPYSYGFRPNRRAHDAIAEIHYYTSRGYDWVLEGDIKACFDEIDHAALMGLVRERIGDKRVLRLVKAFLKSGILSRDLVNRDTFAGTPQGGILSPLLANVALSVLDEHFARLWQRTGRTGSERMRHRRLGGATCRLVRYADDFVILIHGSRHHAEELKSEVSEVLKQVGLRLSQEKTTIAHIDEGFDFLGFRIQRRVSKKSHKQYVYTYPSKPSMQTVCRKVKAICRQSISQPLDELLQQLNWLLRGWANYFRHSSAKTSLNYLGYYTWHRVWGWLRRKHRRVPWKKLKRRYQGNQVGAWLPEQDGVRLFNPATVTITRYRFRGARIPSPWSTSAQPAVAG
ncbi:group II intron reverse transcriptase/maturase [Streptomyces sp. NPDC048664]|uniref:group II intron reverse transcriptase/maturase n=1 Tax=Streptomyces sp. NPDC048664 TaxID=3154505 RepID=UPI003441F623